MGRARGRTVAQALALVIAIAGSARAQPPMPGVVLRALGPAGSRARWPRQPLASEATEQIGVGRARTRWGATGRGATVCIVDSGIDLHHRDFLDTAGHTRVRALLDLSGGAVWTAADIDAALTSDDPALPRDTLGHGTAIASIAAGDDAGDGPFGREAGVAPEADLIVVDAWRDGALGFDDADVAEGARFCAAEGEPGRTVIVLGLGGHDGRHDGTEPLERALAGISAQGVPVVVAAGNDGDRAVHASGWLAAGETARIDLRVPEPDPGSRYVAVQIEGASAVSVVTPDGTRSASVTPGFRHVVDHDGGRVGIDATRERATYVVLAGGGDVPAPLAGGVYGLRVHGPGRFHAWLVGADVGDTLVPPRLAGPFVDPRATITIPATAPEVIAVGATTAEGAVAPWSARGPTVLGVPKPDLVAPGGPMTAALSADLDPALTESLAGGSAALAAGADRITVRGTSFAAPLVAGAIALAQSIDPSLDRARLIAAARWIEGAAWRPAAGAGELDVVAFLRCDREDGPCATGDTRLALSRDVAAPGDALWLVARGPARRATVRTPDGSATSIDIGGAADVISLPPPRGRPGETLRYDVTIDGTDAPPLSLRLHVDGARDAQPPVAGGAGCSSAGTAAALPTPLLLALPALILRRRSRRRSA